jgi:hypothetical protein
MAASAPTTTAMRPVIPLVHGGEGCYYRFIAGSGERRILLSRPVFWGSSRGMAFGTELILGWHGRQRVEDIVTRLGFTFKMVDPSSPRFSPRADIQPESLLESINEKLERVWPKAFEVFPEFAKDNPDRLALKKATMTIRTDYKRKGIAIFRGDKGLHEINPWGLFLSHDPDECGDTDEEMVFGISLTSRYFPTFLDWKDQHGGSGCLVLFNPDTIRAIEYARSVISEVIPEITEATPLVKSFWY